MNTFPPMKNLPPSLLCSATTVTESCAEAGGAGAPAKEPARGAVAVAHRQVEVDGLRIFYREAGPKDAPTLLLLHGFPSSSHQYRRLFDLLGDEFHLVAPDYPGFGHSDAPASRTAGGSFPYTFDRLTDVTEAFCKQLGLTRFFVYMFDFGAPVGFRLAVRHPEWIAGIVSQNGNAYEEGLSAMIRAEHSLPPEEKLAARRHLISREGTKSQYLTGAQHPDRISPDAWTMDQYFLDLPGRDAVMLSLLDDYSTNIAAYPAWQTWLREHRPPVLLAWGKNDPFFVPAGAQAYLRDVPDAELHLLDGGHFALEEHAEAISSLIRSFIGKHSG
ncbi:alpha/beta fold hydrolase [Pendulispora albinea]|uniref:Alpha/beta hydrolase n=1 Tax=Pendulispora albinea TaxID=2741071 RepID=A0ABZ2M6Q1_9BACT